MKAHLDLGCGGIPRNPYGQDMLYGVDIAVRPDDARVRGANLALEPIPFDESSMDSVSAYDFLEHVPRVLQTADMRGTRLPFVELMNEVWRVLKPNGLFYASTPVYPHPTTFQDPTHVNFLTTSSHIYFVEPHLEARMYGFHGRFQRVRTQLARPTEKTLYPPPVTTWWERYKLNHHAKRGRCTHIVWEFRSLK